MEILRTKIIRAPESIDDAKRVRKVVFQIEQGINESADFDGKDNEATHIVVYQKNIPIGTGRIRLIAENKVKIERIAVVKEARNLGIGKLIMKGIHEHLAQNGIANATLDAQYHAKGFYEKLGYQQEGDVFDEEGIPHVVMSKRMKGGV